MSRRNKVQMQDKVAARVQAAAAKSMCQATKYPKGRAVNAAKAGLFEGEPLAGDISVYIGDVTKQARIQVLKGGQKQWVEYLLVIAVRIEITQIVAL